MFKPISKSISMVYWTMSYPLLIALIVPILPRLAWDILNEQSLQPTKRENILFIQSLHYFYNSFNPCKVFEAFKPIFSCLDFSSLNASLLTFFSNLLSLFNSLMAFLRAFFSSKVSWRFRIDNAETRDASVLKIPFH